MTIIYKRQVHYYETDKMGITHHSNYVRWLEEARTYFLEQIGIAFRDMEKVGIMSPVVGVQLDYKNTSTYQDEIAIETSVTHYTGVQTVFEYVIKNLTTNKVAATGNSRHCFTKEGRLCSIARDEDGKPFDQLMRNALTNNEKS